ncbi:hypothetical protein CEE37_08735 [candidate division LCP-89 bacterium B3_LCP]|uniref:PqqD family protein n=1 Tax=candidate division LCP-89 bacterium B3_LCP TaxID=2012998 RepID=A0A532V0A2_UNCL8|nr:MAG: hypothetical protein CEE37_08735 [candidate division LCP-89 bacterium B3_LCP]
MTSFTEQQLVTTPRIASDVRIRSESFGGLVFKGSEMGVYEINDLTRLLLDFIDGDTKMRSLIHRCLLELSCDRAEIEQVLQNMIKAGVLIF